MTAASNMTASEVEPSMSTAANPDYSDSRLVKQSRRSTKTTTRPRAGSRSATTPADLPSQHSRHEGRPSQHRSKSVSRPPKGHRSKSHSRTRSSKSRGSSRRSDEGTETEKDIKKIKGKQILMTGLASAATINALDTVISSVKKRRERHKALEKGELTPEEAQKMKMKGNLQDLASIGIAVIGIQGAISEAKAAKGYHNEGKEWNKEKQEKSEKLQRRLEKLRGH